VKIEIREAKNGFVLFVTNEVDGEFIEEEHVFTRFSQVVKYLRENFASNKGE
jgi:hypothetical protein